MTNSKELLKVISASGLKKKWIASKVGLSYFGLQKKINNESEFKASEIMTLCEILHIESAQRRSEIFFAHEVDKNSTNQMIEKEET